MRSSRLARNTVASLVFQVTTIICGFILPRLILSSFGSEVNGLVTSITQFLGVISFLEMGVGTVVQSSLYKPLAEKNYESVSRIVVSAGRFFRRLAYILLGYIVCLVCIYPILVDQSFGWMYTAGLIAAMSLSSFAQYYFGVVDRLLLTADQRGYIQYNAQTVTLLLNTAVCAGLICLEQPIHVVKLTTSLIYLARPLVLRLYVNKHYAIDRAIQYEGEPIQQKWNGVAQHIASVVLNSSASIILTVFSTLGNVSIYSVYNLVIHGVKQLFLSMTNGVQALMGELWAKREEAQLVKVFNLTEWMIHTGTVFVFGCTGTLLIPFVQVYTKGITDAEYIQPLFAVLYTIAHAGHCLRLPYNIMILAAGHYKQTQSNYIIATALNIVISCICVNLFGLIGVALGAMIALSYQTVWMAWYNARHLVLKSMGLFWKQIFVDLLTVCLGVLMAGGIHTALVSYIDWFILATRVAVGWIVAVCITNTVFYYDRIADLCKKIIAKRR